MLDKSIHFLYLFILIFSPLAFGTVEPWSITVMELTIFLTLFLVALNNVNHSAHYYRNVPGMAALLLFLIYILFQLIPLPGEFLRLLSPEAHTIYNKSAGTDKLPSWFSISLDRHATLSEFFRLASYGAFYFITVQILADRERLKKTLTILLSFASLYAFFTIVQNSLPNGKIYWIRPLPQGDLPFGSYINKNHYAGLMEMIFPLAIALFLYSKPPISYGSLKEKIGSFLLHRRTNIHVLYGLAALLIALSIFLSLSRGAIISLSLAMFLMGLFMAVRREKRENALIIIAFSAFTFFIVGWFGWGPLFEHFQAIRDSHGNITDLRPHIWRDVLLIIKDLPLTGSGLGSFLSVYPKYRTVEGNLLIDHAHNDYLELLSNGGVAAFFLMAAFLLSLFYKSWQAFLTRRNDYAIYLYSGSVTGLVSIMMHALTDFNFQIGANGLYFFFLAGIVLTSSASSPETNYNSVSKKSIFYSARLILLLSVLLFSGSLLYKTSLFTGNVYLAKAMTYMDSAGNKVEASPAAKYLKRAVIFNPLEYRALSLMAHLESKSDTPLKALQSINKAIKNAPLTTSLMRQKALILSRLGRKKEASLFFMLAIDFNQRDPLEYQNYAFWLLNEKRDAEAANYIRKAISLEPEKTGKYISYLSLNKRSPDYIWEVLPEKAKPYLLLARYLHATGKEKKAVEAILKSAQFIEKGEKTEAPLIREIYYFLKGRKMHIQALELMKRGSRLLPDDASLSLLLARDYEETGIKYRALEEYRRTLIVDPDNKLAKKRIESLEKSLLIDRESPL